MNRRLFHVHVYSGSIPGCSSVAQGIETRTLALGFFAASVTFLVPPVVSCRINLGRVWAEWWPRYSQDSW